jgi:serine/threonine protein kinase
MSDDKTSADVEPPTVIGAHAAEGPRADVLAGAVLGHFRVGEVLGKGGMGVVYRAVDEGLQRVVALKVLAPAVAAMPDRRSRFLREARAAAALSHPNIAAIHEVGEDGGRVFIAMELVEGQTLKTRRAAGLPLDEALRLAREVVRGVAHAHDRGVVHRDLKPDNVMVSPEGQVKILDFGLAKRLGPGEGDDDGPHAEASVTRSDQIMGTPGYMSPEQAMGRPVDHRADIFSFGAMLYELTTGSAPFSGTAIERLIATTRDEPAPPAALNARISPALERLILRCLARRPEDRYPNARALSDELDVVIAASSARAPAAPPSLAPVSSKAPAPVSSGTPTPVSSRVPAPAPSAPGATSPGSSPRPAAGTAKPRVLVVDDEPSNLDTMRRSFRKDLVMELASSGREAVQLLKEDPFDVILTDYAMPQMNGVELLREAQALQPRAGRIMITAHAELAEVRAAKSAGLVAVVIMKPWSRDDLLRLVTHVHGVAQMRRTVDQMNTKLGKGS